MVSIPNFFVYSADDYHEFDEVKFIVKKAFGIDFSFESVGFDGFYHAVFWYGEKPVEFIEQKKLA